MPSTPLCPLLGVSKSRRFVLYQQINKLPLVSLRSLALFYIGVAQEGPVKQLELQKKLMGGLEVRREPLVKVALCEGHICTDRQIGYSILVFFSLLRWGSIPQNSMNIMNVKVMINYYFPTNPYGHMYVHFRYTSSFKGGSMVLHPLHLQLH